MKRIIGLIAALALAGCATAPGALDRREQLSRQIADDAASFNDAYGQAVTGQILLNILRGRDRLPRHYLSMTGISDAPSIRRSQSAGIGSVPLGEGGSPWGFGNIGVERSTETQPSYAVQPFSAETLTRTAFEPTAPHVFAHYWASGWPRDLLLLLLVERIEKVGPDGARASFTNEANEIFDNCAPSVETGGCAFVRELRDFLTTIQAASAAPETTHGERVCGLVEAYAPPRPVRAAPAQTGLCDPVFVVGGSRITFKLRSLDDVVYYVGELMRAGAMQSAPGKPIEAQLLVRAAGLRGGGRGVPLFRILPADSAGHGLYAASVDYGGARYSAGPAIGRSCSEARVVGSCVDDSEHGDRSSSVLSLIAELLALNQSPDAIRAPSRLIAE